MQRPLISVDTETTGLDLHHGAKPFLVTTCDEQDNTTYWEWFVDPFTREPQISKHELQEIGNTIFGSVGDDGPNLVLQNSKFDVTALSTILPAFSWPWDRTHDTLLAGHLLASNKRHNLTDMLIQYSRGRINITPYEKAVERAVQECRRLCRTKKFKSKHGEWAIAKEGREDMPSASEKTWKYDMWLPRAIAKVMNYPNDHHYWTVTSDYANTDSSSTMILWKRMCDEMTRRSLWKLYEAGRPRMRIAEEMQNYGVTVLKDQLDVLQEEYEEEAERCVRVCTSLAASYNHELFLPKGGGRNQNLMTFIFDVLKMPVLSRTDKGGPSIDKYAMDEYQLRYPESTKSGKFIKKLMDLRKRCKAMESMTGYLKFGVPITDYSNYIRLHPFLNPCGTHTLRWSSENPNSQNISKKGIDTICNVCRGDDDTCTTCNGTGKVAYTLRSCLGPLPGREWWSLDYENLELRIPAYDSGEQAMIDLFERPNDPPYFGSNHLLACHILHPDMFNACVNDQGIVDGRLFKKKYNNTWYSWTKNGNFAVQYGAQESSGTADRAYHVPGGQRKIQQRLGKINDLNRRMIEHAEQYKYVETMPDKTVDPERGYPLLCTLTDWGKILPTVPLSYRVQGTACWMMLRAMDRCDQLIKKWNSSGFDCRMIMNVHDELVFDMPKSVTHPKTDYERYKADPLKAQFRTSNYWRVLLLKRIMEQSGTDIGVPTPVSVSYHEHNWSDEVKL